MTKVGSKLESPDCDHFTCNQEGGICKHKKACITMSSLRDPVFRISDRAPNVNGTFGLNPSVSTLCQHSAEKINSCVSSAFMNYIKST